MTGFLNRTAFRLASLGITASFCLLAGCSPVAKNDPPANPDKPTPADNGTTVATTSPTPDTPQPLSASTSAPAADVHKPGDLDGENKPLFTRGEMSQLDEINREYEKLSNGVLPAVVSLSCSYPEDPTVSELFPFHIHPKHGHPGSSPDGPSNMSFGSGVIISHDGFIVTNHHVVDMASKIEVRLSDHRKFSARLIASDEAVDLAVIKIDVTGLPALPWGDSDKLLIGEQVFAAGNPFNLNDSFTNGIVSAKSRNLNSGDGSIEDFIQTNAAINPGNSGGALVNIRGELVGINAAIASASGTNSGVGFAIPSNLAKFAVMSLIKNGHFIRGFLGVQLQPDSDSDEVRNQLGLDTDEGALVFKVEDASPAQAAKILPGDFITEVDGHHISSADSLRLVVAQLTIGKTVIVAYIRNGQTASTKVTIAQMPSDTVASNTPPTEPSDAEAVPQSVSNAKLTVVSGIKVGDLNPKNRQQLKVDPKIKGPGALVMDVTDGSLAQLSDIKPGDIILNARVNRGAGHQIATADDFNKLVQNVQPGESVLLLVTRGDGAGGFINLSASKLPR